MTALAVSLPTSNCIPTFSIGPENNITVQHFLTKLHLQQIPSTGPHSLL